MDSNSVRSTLSGLALGNVMAAAARDYQKELLAQGKAQTAAPVGQEEVDLDELMDDPELEKLHADRIAALKSEVERRQVLQRQGHGEYREISEGEFLGEVTKTEKVICHFYHREFYRCKIIDKHLKSLAPRHFDTKFIKLDAENAPFFVAKLAVRTLPCIILFSVPVADKLLCCNGGVYLGTPPRNGIANDRIIGFQDLGGKDDFATVTLERLLIKKGIIEKKESNEEDEQESKGRSIRSSTYNSDSD